MPPELTEKLLWVLLGAAVSGAGAYLVLARDLSFIKGQLSEVLRVVATIEKLQEKLGALKDRVTTAEKDLNYAFERLRNLERDGDYDNSGHG